LRVGVLRQDLTKLPKSVWLNGNKLPFSQMMIYFGDAERMVKKPGRNSVHDYDELEAYWNRF